MTTYRARCPVCGKRFQADRKTRVTCSDLCRQRRSRGLRASTPQLPPGPFSLIYADPPWHFDIYSARGQGKSPSQHYRTMDITSICQLPVAALAAPNAHLALWVYDPRLPDGFRVAAAWGFPHLAGVGFTWDKTKKDGTGNVIRTGFYTRKSTEQCLFFSRGEGLKRVNRGVRQIVHAPRREHSRKPDEVADRLVLLFGDVPRVELFARRPRAGWSAWGNELAADAAALKCPTPPPPSPASAGEAPPPLLKEGRRPGSTSPRSAARSCAR